jgi:hypothetical protein
MVGKFFSGAIRAPDLIELVANRLIKESGNDPDTQWTEGGTGWYNGDVTLKSRPYGGKFTVSSPGNGTFAAGGGAGVLKTVWLRCRNKIGAADINVTITYDTKTCLTPTVIPAGSEEGTTIKVFLNSPDAGALAINNIGISGGTAGDSFEGVFSISADTSSRRVLINADEGTYLCMEVVNNPYTYSDAYTYDALYSKGIRFIWSQSWDSGSHTYPPVNMMTYMGYQGVRGDLRYAPYNAYLVTADLDTQQLIFWLWAETTGFALMGYPESNANDNYQQAFFTSAERNTNKEYTDGYTSFVHFMDMNILLKGRTGYLNGKMNAILRPFAYQSPSSGSDFDWSVTTFSGNGIHIPYNAFKSNGNGKVYYVKPIVSNHAGSTMPIFQCDQWFYWTEGLGLVDGDIIAIQGSTKKYICKSVSSPDSTTKLTFAMKYSN